MKPILFNIEMVRAILNGRKTETRRVIKPQPPVIAQLGMNRDQSLYCYAFDDAIEHPGPDDRRVYMAPYRPSDILYVRETWQRIESGRYIYRADITDRGSTAYYNEYARLDGGWRPSIHMPKEAARLFLRVTDVRVERLQDIKDDEIANEGVIPSIMLTGERINGKVLTVGLHLAWQELWDSTIKPTDRDRYGWAANPWVWVICFERCEKPEVAT